MHRKNVRTIRTDYYRGNRLIKSTYSKWANNAVGNAVKHMRSQVYDCNVCEVYDTEIGVLHAVVAYSRTSRGGRMEIVYKRGTKDEHFPEA